MTDTIPAVPDETPPATALWAWFLILGICVIHVVLALSCFGGLSGLRSETPLALHDHSIQEHNAWVARPMILKTGFSGGYDPYFMAGYAKSIWSSPSSTMFEVTGLITGGKSPAIVYKFVLFLAISSMPFLVALACALLGIGGIASLAAVLLYFVYLWTGGASGGYPLNYASVGMTAYLVSVPFGLVSTAALVRFLRRGGFLRWFAATLLTSLVFLVHLTSVLFLAPAGIAAAIVLPEGTARRGARRFAVLWTLPIVVVLLNAFWILPASLLRTTRAPAMAFLSHSNEEDPVLGRLWKMVWIDPEIQVVSIGLGLVGYVALCRRDRTAAAALGTFAFTGFAFGYLAGSTEKLDFIQPGRQTHALYSAACVLAGVGVAEIVRWVRRQGSRRMSIAALIAASLIGFRIVGQRLELVTREKLGKLPQNPSLPFLSSYPRPAFATIVETLRKITKPGDRIFYEEVGKAFEGEPDPYSGGRYSGLLPQMLGVEVIGGFYLHIGVSTNFTQIGEGKFFGKETWEVGDFNKYATIYRPSAIVCFSQQARTFCLKHPELVDVVYQKERLLIGRVRGFEGPAILGKAEVLAYPGGLKVSAMVPDLDGLVLLRYHVVPGMRCKPETPFEAIFQADDPVPFLGLRPSKGQSEVQVDIGFPTSR